MPIPEVSNGNNSIKKEKNTKRITRDQLGQHICCLNTPQVKQWRLGRTKVQQNSTWTKAKKVKVLCWCQEKMSSVCHEILSVHNVQGGETKRNKGSCCFFQEKENY